MPATIRSVLPAADPIQRFAGDDVEIPGLGVHRRRRAHRQTDDFLDKRLGYWIGFVTADAPATEDNVIKLHLSGILRMNPESAWMFAVSRPSCKMVARRANPSRQMLITRMIWSKRPVFSRGFPIVQT
jgi:hypothetical protein